MKFPVEPNWATSCTLQKVGSYLSLDHSHTRLSEDDMFMDLCRLKWAAQMFGLGQQYLECESTKRRINKKPMNIVFFCKRSAKICRLKQNASLAFDLAQARSATMGISYQFTMDLWGSFSATNTEFLQEFVIVCSIYKYGSGI